MKTTFIYALKEPDTGEIRYIGKSDNLKRRLRDHCGTKEKNHRGYWIRALKKMGLKPVLEIVDEIPYEFRDQLERAYITFFYEQGCNLVNGTPGGEDPPSSLGATRTPEHRKAISVAHKGKKLSPDHCAKISAARTGLKFGPHTPEWCANISAAKTGKKRAPFTPEHCAKMSAAQTLRQEKKRQESYLAEMWR